jgi:hypothetical protein
MSGEINQSCDGGLCGLIFLGRHPCDELAKSNQHNIRMKFQRKRSISKVLAPGAAAVLGISSAAAHSGYACADRRAKQVSQETFSLYVP